MITMSVDRLYPKFPSREAEPRRHLNPIPRDTRMMIAVFLSDLIASLTCELNPEVTQTADSVHSNEIAMECAAVPQHIVGRCSRRRARALRCLLTPSGLLGRLARTCERLPRTLHACAISYVALILVFLRVLIDAAPAAPYSVCEQRRALA